MENKIFGTLFETIKLENEEHLEAILKTMDKNSATYILTQAISYAYKRGAFSLGEAEVISKSLRVLNNIEEKSGN